MCHHLTFLRKDIVKKIAVIVLVTAALGFSAAPPAHAAWSSFIKHLSKNACQGKNSYFKNGCYAYIEPRVDKASKPDAALDWCKNTRCKCWFSNTSSGQKTCIEGCEYLYKMGD